MIIHNEHISWNQQESQEILKGPNLKPLYFALNVPSALPLKSLLKTQNPFLNATSKNSKPDIFPGSKNTSLCYRKHISKFSGWHRTRIIFCTKHFIRTSRLKMKIWWQTKNLNLRIHDNFQNTELHRIFLKEQCKKKIKNMEAQMGKILRTPSFEIFL